MTPCRQSIKNCPLIYERSVLKILFFISTQYQKSEICLKSCHKHSRSFFFEISYPFLFPFQGLVFHIHHCCVISVFVISQGSRSSILVPILKSFRLIMRNGAKYDYVEILCECLHTGGLLKAKAKF